MAEKGKKKEEEKEQAQVVNVSTTMNTPYVDMVTVGIRDDNVGLVRFFTNLPEGIFEQARVMASGERLKKFADLLCETMDYYPTKEKK